MLMPKRVKHRKQMKGRMSGKPCRGIALSFGEFGLQATECGWLDSRQIEAARVAMTRYIKRGGKIWIRVFPGWAKVKVLLIHGLLLSSQERFYMRWKA